MVGSLLLLHGAAAAAAPNILFILADDLGYGDVSTYPNPTKRGRIDTPNLAKLTSEGMKFTDAYAGYSVCAPSRTTLMTGFHCGHFAPNNGGGPLLKNGSTTVAHVLRSAGYTTALMGKWGLDGNYPVHHSPSVGFPTRMGFDWFYGQSDQYECHNYYPAKMYNDTDYLSVAANEGASKLRCGKDYGRCSWSADLWTRDAIDYISNEGGSRRPVDKPFFLYLAYTSPHAGSVGGEVEDDVPGPRLSSSRYANQTSWPSVERDFANTVTQLDAGIGAVLKAVDDSGLRSTTVVFFSSDNGAHQEGGHKYQFFNSSGYLNGFKRSIHDGGHRAALIVRWPGVTPAGAVSKQQWAFYDFLPTAAAIAGVGDGGLPPHLDGYSLLPTLKGGSQEQPGFVYHDFANCQDPVVKQAGLNCGFGQNIRSGNWSCVCVGGKKPCTGEGGYVWEYSGAEGEWGRLDAGDSDVLERAVGGEGVEFVTEGMEGQWTLSSSSSAATRNGRSAQLRRIFASGHVFLYDMSVDEGQLHDVASQHSDVVADMLKLMHDQYQPNNWPPQPPVPAADVSGNWTQLSGHGDAMRIAVDGSTAVITCVEPCSCCRWRSGNFTLTTSPSTELHGTAVGPDGFSTVESGAVSRSDSGLRIKWSGDRGWADWTKP